MSRALAAAALSAFLVTACEHNKPAGAGEVVASSGFPVSATADSLLNAGEAVYRRSEYDSATMLLSAGRSKAVAEGDSVAVARADTWLGLTAMRQGRNDEARRIGEKALAMKIRLGVSHDLFRSYNALGLLAYQQGRLSDALELFSSARRSAEAAADSVGIAKAIGNSGLPHSDIGQLDQARSDFSFFAGFARATGDTLSLANSLSNLGMVESRAGNPVAAIEWLQQARPLYTAIDYPAGEESVLGQLAVAYASLGEQQKAIAYIDSAIRVASAHDLVREEAEDTQIYGELIGEAGDHNAALRHLTRARLLADSADLESRRGDIARAEARELAAIGSIDRAVASAKIAVSIHHSAKAEFEELYDHLLIAELEQSVGNSGDARAALARAYGISSKLGLPIAKELVALGRARVADISKDAASVLRALPANMPFSHLGPAAEGEAEALRARAFGRLAQWPEAAASGRRAVETIEMLRQNIGEGPLRSAFVGDKSAVFADLVVSLLKLDRTSEAFEVAEAARGSALLERLIRVGRGGAGSANDVAEANRLLRKIDFLAERLRMSDTMRAPDRTVAVNRDQRELVARLAAARSEYEDRMRRAARVDARGAALLGASHSPSRAIRDALDPNEVMLEYFAASDRLFTFVVTKDTVTSMVQSIGVSELANRVRIAAQLLRRPEPVPGPNPVMRSLHEVLIEPVMRNPRYLRATSLVVVPHSALSYLPFAALVGRDGRPVIESKSILTLSSASSLPQLRAIPAASTRPANSIFAPFPDELRGTREEAIRVRTNLRDSRIFLGRSATEKQLRWAFESGSNVHVASHAVLDQANPMFSHVALVPGNKGPDDDGTLDVHELLGMRVRSSLVYLSGCETGAGAEWSTGFRRTPDYATLSQAILFAGAQNVVATLWRIDDQGASVFAERFYQALRGASPTAALATAQRQTMRDSRFSAPKYWAAYTISGSGRIENSQGRNTVAVQ